MTTLAELQAELVARARRPLSRHLHRPLVYVALGASDAAGWGASSPVNSYVELITARLRAHYRPDRRVVRHNLGVAGYTIVDIERDELPSVPGLAPDLVTLWTGGNDIVQSVDAGSFQASLVHILAVLQRLDAAVFVGTVPDLSVVPLIRSMPGWLLPVGDPIQYARRRAQELGALVLRQTAVHSAHLVPLPMGEILQNPALVAPDGFHPSDAGHARLAEAWWQEIAPLLD